MSVKVPYGFKLRSNNLREVIDLLTPVCADVARVLVRRRAEFLAQNSVERVDRLALLGLCGYQGPAAPPTVSAIFSAWDELEDRQAKMRRTLRRDPAVDFEVAFRLWLCRDTQSIVGVVLGEDAAHFHRMLLEAGIASGFAYWNNCDPEVGVTDEQWAARGLVWDNLFARRSGTPFDVRVDEPPLAWGISPDVLEALPTLDKRVKHHTYAVAYATWTESAKATNPESNASFAARSVRQLLNFAELRHAGDAEVTSLFQHAEEQVRARLQPITSEALTELTFLARRQ